MRTVNVANKRSYLLFPILLGLILNSFVVCSVLAQTKPKELKWATFFNETDYNAPTLKMFRDDITSFSNGAVKPRLYWSGEIAELKDLPSLNGGGAIEMTSTAPANYPSLFPLNGVLTMFPVIFKHPAQAAYTWRGLFRDLPEVQAEYAKQNLYCLNRSSMGMYFTISKKPIRKLADLKGMKIRGVPGKYFAEMLKSAGAIPLATPAPEIYEALMRGVLDAVMINPQSMDAMRLYEVAKYVSMPVGTIVGFHNTINLDLWKGLAPETRDAITQAAFKWGERDLKLQIETSDRAVESLKKKGVQFIEFDPKDWQNLLAKGGDPWTAIRDELITLRVTPAVADKYTKRIRELTQEHEQNYLSKKKNWEYK